MGWILPLAPALKYSQTVFAIISPSPKPVSASEMTGSPDANTTSFIYKQNLSKDSKLIIKKNCVLSQTQYQEHLS